MNLAANEIHVVLVLKKGWNLGSICSTQPENFVQSQHCAAHSQNPGIAFQSRDSVPILRLRGQSRDCITHVHNLITRLRDLHVHL